MLLQAAWRCSPTSHAPEPLQLRGAGGGGRGLTPGVQMASDPKVVKD